jgi:hypothetical protein
LRSKPKDREARTTLDLLVLRQAQDEDIEDSEPPEQFVTP